MIISQACNIDSSAKNKAKKDIEGSQTQPVMASIAYFDPPGTTPDDRKVVLLGSTIGAVANIAKTIIPDRQKLMLAAEFIPNNDDQLASGKAPGAPGFGKCAETAFWLFARA